MIEYVILGLKIPDKTALPDKLLALRSQFENNTAMINWLWIIYYTCNSFVPQLVNSIKSHLISSDESRFQRGKIAKKIISKSV